LEKILAFFLAEIMGSPNILLGIPLIKKYNRENHNIDATRRGLGKFVRWKRVWNPVVCVKNVGAGAGNEHMDI